MKHGILIDAENKVIRPAIIDKVLGLSDFDNMKREIGIDIAEPIDLGNGVTMWCDEEGRLKSGQHWFRFNGNLIAGSAMVVFGDYAFPRLSDRLLLNRLIEFVDAEGLDEADTEPDCGFIGSLEECDAAIAAGQD